MRCLLLTLLLAQVGSAEPPWWELHAGRYRHVEGWSVPVPAGWRAHVDGDALELANPDGRLRVVVVVLDSQAEADAALKPIYADMARAVPRRWKGPDGLQFTRRTVALKDRQVSAVHVVRGQSHLVVLYHVKHGALPDAVEALLRLTRFSL